MTFTFGSVVGFFFGFTFGVGCALAVMYSIYLGGYRKAILESAQTPQPERYVQTSARVLRKS